MRSAAFLFIMLVAASVHGLTTKSEISEVTLPPNIAPFAFRVIGAGTATVSLRDAAGGTLAAKMSSAGVTKWKEKAWHAFLARNAGKDVFFDISCGSEHAVLTNHVATEAIDSHLTYRLIPPGYAGYSTMGIYRRDLESFAEEVVERNVEHSYNQCVNCHIPNRTDPEEYVRSYRVHQPGMRIVSRRHGDRKVQIRNFEGCDGGAAYAGWHPSGDYIAFSINQTLQIFSAGGRDLIEVYDRSSDVLVYSLADDERLPVETSREFLETCPAWSPDGRILYTVRTHNPEGEPTAANVRDIRYDLVERRFDAERRSFSEPRTLFAASSSKKSASWPRPSTDGRWLVFTLADHGYFHIWHGDADLYILDLQTGAVRALDEINSKAAESYHSFSHDGHWMVFSSRRDDGTYTRPYFAHFDPASGRFGRPFPLPIADPDLNLRRMKSYNVPEFER